MDIEFIELDLDWPCEVSVYDLRNHVISKLINYGEPLRWAITASTPYSEKNIQKISIEAVLIIQDKKTKNFNTNLN